ncbi:hypothetical protein QVD17_19864 [Tagetes erecta]|uniref:LisH domain-containing protein n=1 Tax=Tagetes erecta TaxID=13708 RepID=A0AAD8NXL3_TARER|nr:hypothetical protein QVD17_19864 [Tagetes erecta]
MNVYDENGVFNLSTVLCFKSLNVVSKQEMFRSNELPMSSLSRDLVFLILQFLDEEKFKETAPKLQELGLFFNLKHFEDEMHNGNLDEVEKYLSGFTKVDDNRYITNVHILYLNEIFVTLVAFQPTPTVVPTSLAGWMSIQPSVSHPMVSVNAIGLGSLSVSAALKHPRTPTNTSFDYPSFVKVFSVCSFLHYWDIWLVAWCKPGNHGREVSFIWKVSITQSMM